MGSFKTKVEQAEDGSFFMPIPKEHAKHMKDGEIFLIDIEEVE